MLLYEILVDVVFKTGPDGLGLFLGQGQVLGREHQIIVVQVDGLHNGEVIPVDLGHLDPLFFVDLLLFFARLALHVLPLEPFGGPFQHAHFILDRVLKLSDILFFRVETIVVSVHQVREK